MLTDFGDTYESNVEWSMGRRVHFIEIDIQRCHARTKWPIDLHWFVVQLPGFDFAGIELPEEIEIRHFLAEPNERR